MKNRQTSHGQTVFQAQASSVQPDLELLDDTVESACLLIKCGGKERAMSYGEIDALYESLAGWLLEMDSRANGDRRKATRR